MDTKKRGLVKMIYLDQNNKIDDKKLKEIANEMRDGKIAIFPTETVYGIGTNGFNEKALRKLYQIKNRNFKNPLNLLVNSTEMIELVAKDISKLEYALMKAFFPGPFTIILKKKSIVPNIITNNTDLVGVRIPNHPIAKKLVNYANIPIACPSANLSGKLSNSDLQNVNTAFLNKVDYIINAGQTNLGIESTIVRIIDGIPHILRPGNITAEQIRKIAGNVIIDSHHFSNVEWKHYQLDTKSTLVYSEDISKMTNEIKIIAKKYNNPIILCYSENKKAYSNFNIIDIGSNKDLKTVSSNLFLNLKKAQNFNSDIILIEGIKESGLGLAIMNRLLNVCNNSFIKI